MSKTTFWYSVVNCGDGSAYPSFMASEELCELHQKQMDEGWGESCVGSFMVESDSPVTAVGDIMTAEDLLKELQEELSYTTAPYAARVEEKILEVEEFIVKRDGPRGQ
jgi:hypothetical protein